VQAAFDRVPGVVSTAVGYTGGHVENPSYEQVCSGKTGHAEAVQVEFDPKKVSFEELLRVFWSIHNPTERNRQGPDAGEQYRSAIFYHSEEQKQAALASKKDLEELGKYDLPIATVIVKAGPFFRAEEYHQKYAERRGRGVC
jgi:peptide-methionine (S)-S-oxide reductase